MATEEDNYRKMPWLNYGSDTDIELGKAVFETVNPYLETLINIISALEKRSELPEFVVVLKEILQEDTPFNIENKKKYTDPHNLTAAILIVYNDANSIEQAQLRPLLKGLKDLVQEKTKDNHPCELATAIKNQFLSKTPQLRL